jgi:FSR family fosmidomycin resistance protein-like MFS transporter
VGFITATYQLTASLLQPIVGLYSDRRPLPFSLPTGAVFTLLGLLAPSVSHTYALLLGASCLVGLGSAIFHPESARVARMASGGRYGLAQSLFQVGGNFGQALGPLMAAAIVLNFGQGSIAWFVDGAGLHHHPSIASASGTNIIFALHQSERQAHRPPGSAARFTSPVRSRFCWR